jgi:hypothetical protein
MRLLRVRRRLRRVEIVVIVRRHWRLAVRRLGRVRVPILLVGLVVEAVVAYRLVASIGTAGFLVAAANRPERLAFGTLDLGRIGTPSALELQVLANRVVE